MCDALVRDLEGRGAELHLGVAVTGVSTDDGKVLHTFNGRWVDTFERRDGPHRIAQRILRVDWTRRDPWHDDMAGAYVPSGRDRTDPVYGNSADR